MQLQPVDGTYFLSAYFYVSVVVSLVIGIASVIGEIE